MRDFEDFEGYLLGFLRVFRDKGLRIYEGFEGS